MKESFIKIACHGIMVEGGPYIYHGINEEIHELYINSETCLNRTLSKPKTCINQTDFTVPSTKFLCNLDLYNK
jgi:hypothetical protein